MTGDTTRKYERWTCVSCGRFPPAFAPTFAPDPERWVCPGCRDS